MNAEVRVVEDAEEIAREAAIEFAMVAREAVIQHGVFTVALAGGSTPRHLYSLIAEKAAGRSGVEWDTVHFFFGDERCVPPDHADSNYRMARQALFDHIPVPPQNVHRVRCEEGDSAHAANFYEYDLRGFFVARQALRGGFPRFDLVFLGLGADGHTASLFPGTKVIWEQHRWVLNTWVEKLQVNRITMTPPVLNAADRVLFLVSGEEKAEALEQVLGGENDPGRLPAQIVRPKDGALTWLVDRAAARRLGKA